MYHVLLRIVVISSVTLLVQSASQAQHFSFSVGGHGHGHHHHGHWHGCDPCWGPWYGPSFGVIYAPPVRERVIYVEPPRTTVVLPQATAPIAAPVSTWTAATPANSAQITIRNASGTKLPVAFLVDGQDVELADGQSQTFSGQARHTVQYDRGGRFGSTEQNLPAGTYDFRITASGWDLVRQPDVPAASRTAVRANSLPLQR